MISVLSVTACDSGAGDAKSVSLNANCKVSTRGCDIREAECQRLIYRATACVNDVAGGKIPDIRTITLDEFEAELQAESASAEPEASGWSTAFGLLGLLPTGETVQDAAISVAVNGIAAYFDDVTKDVTVIDRGDNQDPEDELFTLSHEFVHAQRDQFDDLGAFRDEFATSTDSFMAVKGLVEGEAMVVSLAVVAADRGRSTSDIDWTGYGEAVLDSALMRIEASDAPLLTAIQSLSYGLGALRLGPLWEAEGRDVIDSLYGDPDLSLLAFATDTASKRTQPLSCYPTSPPPSYIGEDHDSLGLVGLLALRVSALGSSGVAAFEASQQWRNDSLVVFRPQAEASSPERAVAWRIALDSSESAAALAKVLSGALPGGAQANAIDREVLIFAASDQAVLDAWSEVTACGSESELPKPESSVKPPDSAAIRAIARRPARPRTNSRFRR